MSKCKARPIKTEKQSEIAIEISGQGTAEVLRESVPAGFPSELRHHLAEFMARGFNAACERQVSDIPSLVEYAPSTRGRSIDPEREALGKLVAELRSQGYRYPHIAALYCPQKRSNPQHRCNKECADYLRQAEKDYLARREIEKLRNPDKE